MVNDFGAVAHAVASSATAFQHTFADPKSAPRRGDDSVVGPGTGLGVAALLRHGEDYEVIETEGGHVDFAPLDSLEDQILVELRDSFRRVSVERLASGRGLMNIYEALGAIESRPLQIHDERELWTAALAGSDSLASAALDRFCLTLGAFAGDVALAQGAKAVVIGGGARLASRQSSGAFGVPRPLHRQGPVRAPYGRNAGEADHLSRSRACSAPRRPLRGSIA